MPIDIHGKEYFTVVERMGKLIEEHKKEYSLKTKLLSIDDKKVVVQATLSFKGNEYTGLAMELIGGNFINEYSALENCETSAIGRALSSAGYFGTEFCSANELENAVFQQKETKGMKEERKQLGKKPKKVELSDNPVSVDEVVEKLGGELIANNDDSPKITFGKHEGKKWSEVDDSWLIWIRENNEKWGETAEKEIQRRRNNPKKVTDNNIPL